MQKKKRLGREFDAPELIKIQIYLTEAAQPVQDSSFCLKG